MPYETEAHSAAAPQSAHFRCATCKKKFSASLAQHGSREITAFKMPQDATSTVIRRKPSKISKNCRYLLISIRSAYCSLCLHVDLDENEWMRNISKYKKHSEKHETSWNTVPMQWSAGVVDSVFWTSRTPTKWDSQRQSTCFSLSVIPKSKSTQKTSTKSALVSSVSSAFIFPFPILYHLVLHQAINPLKQSLCGAPCLRGNSGDTWQLWRSNDIYDIYLFLTYLQCVYIVQRFHTDLILSWKLVQIVGQVLSGRTTWRHLLRRSGELRKVLSLTWRIWTYLNYIRKDITSQWPRNNPKQSWNVINTVTLG